LLIAASSGTFCSFQALDISFAPLSLSHVAHTSVTLLALPDFSSYPGSIEGTISRDIRSEFIPESERCSWERSAGWVAVRLGLVIGIRF
jgi:hypothetical protein